MDVIVRTRHIDFSEALRDYAARRVQFAIGAFAQRLDQADVCIADVNGPRGGVDKQCVLTLSLKAGGSVFARGTGTDVYSAVDRAATRIRVLLVRRLSAWTASRRPERRLSG